MRTERVEGEIQDGRSAERVHARLGPHTADDPVDDGVEGVFEPSPHLEVGKAVHLHLDDGREALVVMVNEHGRFLSVGPLS